jgi:DNA mismatch repair protein MutS
MTPMHQYQAAKDRYPGMLLLFRVGDSFELYGDDARTAAKTLGLSLTQRPDRNNGQAIHVAGFSHEALEQHLHTLLRLGHRVALCEQVDHGQPESSGANIQPSLFGDLED